MLRLRPSELTLTPDDVEEAFRRIALRPAPSAPTVVCARASGQPGRPILRRGPQRSTQDAVTALGNIPILRPQPQQANYASVHGDTEDDPGNILVLATDHSNNPGTSPPFREEYTASARTSTLSPPRGIHLPFRLGRNRRSQSTQSTPGNDTHSAGASTPPAAVLSAHAIDTSNVTTGTNNVLGGSSHYPPETTDGPVELRGGGTSSKHRGRAISRDASHAPSALQQVQIPSSSRMREPPRDALTSQGALDESPPTCYLEGFFKDPRTSPVGIHYHFNEYRPLLPHTEPRRRTGRHPTLTRSLSSGNAPASAWPSLMSDPSSFSRQTLFGSALVSDPLVGSSHGSSSLPTQQTQLSYSLAIDQAGARPRRFSSGTSSASAAFSYYGSDLPASRQSSSEQASQNHLGNPQRNPGAHLVGSDAGVSNDTPVQSSLSRDSSQSSFKPASSGQLGMSPLPLVPYTRPQSPYNSPQPMNRGIRPIMNGDYLDASTAAAQDLPSALDAYSTQYQRIVRVQQGQQTMPARPYSLQRHFHGFDANRTHQVMDNHHDLPVPRATPSGQVQLRTLHPTHQLSEHLSGPQPQMPQSYGRYSQITRTSQRSSENVPVHSTSDEGHSARPSQVQIQRAAYEQMNSSAQAFQAVNNSRAERLAPERTHVNTPQANGPRDLSNRLGTQPRHQLAATSTSHYRNEALPSSASPFLDPSQVPHSDAIHNRQLGSPPRARHRITAQHDSQQHRGENPRHTHMRPYSQGPNVAPPSLHLALDQGSGITSRRSRSPLARPTTSMRTRPRISLRQRDQENSGDGEIMLMRREEAAINARHAEDTQQHVMDETPPRVGRVERHMFE